MAVKQLLDVIDKRATVDFFSRQSGLIMENGLRDIIRNVMARHLLALICPFTVIYLRFFVLL